MNINGDIMETYILSTPSAEHIGIKLQEMGANVLFLGKNKDGERFFPDGEQYTRIPDIEMLGGNRVVVLHSGMPDPNGGLIWLQNTLYALQKPTKSEKLGNKKFKYSSLEQPKIVDVFFTYCPYARQDKGFETGEAIAAENVFRSIVNDYGANHVFTIDLHCAGAEWIKKYPVTNISANDELMSAIEKDGYIDVISIGPDAGAQMRNGINGLDKERKNSFEVRIQANQELNIYGKTVRIIDDVISTGRTMVDARDAIMKCGANDVVAAITHGVMTEGIEKVYGAYGGKFYLTNTINRPEANVDITRLVWETIMNQ